MRTPCRAILVFLGPVMLILGMALVSASPAFCQDTSEKQPEKSVAKPRSGIIKSLEEYLNMAGQDKQPDFKPLSQGERNHMFAKSLINPIWYARGLLSAGANQLSDIPGEWEQGASGYGKRFADIMGQYTIRKTVMFGFEGLLHEDNRYFGSGKKGFWPRTGYSLSSGLLARHDNGKRYPSVSLLIGFASGAYLSRFWQPQSTRSVGDAAASFGVSMGWNIGLGMLKEFMPDILRPITARGKKDNGKHASGTAWQ